MPIEGYRLARRGLISGLCLLACGCLPGMAALPAAQALVINIRPHITSPSLRPATFKAAARGPSVTPVVRATKRRVGTVISYGAFQVTATTFTVQRPAPGRRRGRSCVKPTRQNTRARPCTRYVRLGSFTHVDNISLGTATFRFTGRLGRVRLRPGAYRLEAQPRGSGGVGPSVHAQFVIAH
jgi:hypothetical protein